MVEVPRRNAAGRSGERFDVNLPRRNPEFGRDLREHRGGVGESPLDVSDIDVVAVVKEVEGHPGRDCSPEAVRPEQQHILL